MYRLTVYRGNHLHAELFEVKCIRLQKTAYRFEFWVCLRVRTMSELEFSLNVIY